MSARDTMKPLSHGMVLAAGLGLRMRPITETLPKPLVRVAGRTMLDHAIDRMIEGGVGNVVVNMHYLPEQVESHMAGRDDLAVTLSDERGQLLETGGGVAKALPYLDDGSGSGFFVANSDTLLLNGPIPALARMGEVWDPDNMDALLLVHLSAHAFGYDGVGDFLVDPVGRLERRPEGEVAPFLFTGVQILHPRLFSNVPEGPFSLNLLYDRAIESGRAFGIVHDGEWFHVGTPDALNEVEVFMGQRFPESRRR
ncbi:nucleotidyltransferase family protein [Magnetospira sp. QH-2]|uniref:nucleotidyltransferase family protein n=1 Tax=Magnetospira sp. (strain QH-2) TaxID=1288970 RepID=UPI0003E8129F|nr:nucleotidyltransferase family protein [Magnetospira sp. QH-2]CCQ72588.1 putative nucleotidyl transferase [Magnetospira sp. QH-2]